MKKRFNFSGVILAVCLWPLASVVMGQELVAGTLFDHSGALKDWGPRHQRAVELSAKQMAVAGFTIKWVHADSQTSAEAGIKEARRLVDRDKAAAIIGSSSSGVIVPVAESVTCPAKVILISPGATSPYLTNLPQDEDLIWFFAPARPTPCRASFWAGWPPVFIKPHR